MDNGNINQELERIRNLREILERYAQPEERDQERQEDTPFIVKICNYIGFIIKILFFLLIIILFILWIIALRNGNELNIKNKCPDSDIWLWLLFWGLYTNGSIILNNKNINNDNRDNHEDNKLFTQLCFAIISIIISVGLSWWGRKQMTIDNWCIERNFPNSIFWKFSWNIWWYSFIVLVFIGLLISIILISLMIYIPLSKTECGILFLSKFGCLQEEAIEIREKRLAKKQEIEEQKRIAEETEKKRHQASQRDLIKHSPISSKNGSGGGGGGGGKSRNTTPISDIELNVV